MLLRILLIIFFAIIFCFFFRKLIESIINLFTLLDKKNYYNITMQHQGIVLNKKTKKLEADNSLILPF